MATRFLRVGRALHAQGSQRRAELTSSVVRGSRRYQSRPDSHQQCLDTVRKSDIENFLCMPFVPSECLNPLVAIRAFNVEVGKSADKAKDSKLIEIRLQWWRNAVESFQGGKPPYHPVVDSLCEAFHTHQLDIDLLLSVIDRRIEDLDVPHMETMAKLEAYARGTQGALAQLSLHVLGAHTPPHNLEAAEHVGTAAGLCLLLRFTRLHALKNKVYLPKEITSANKLQLSVLEKGEGNQELSQCVYEVAMVAREHLKIAAGFVSAISTCTLSGTLPWVAGALSAWGAELKPTREALPALYPAAIPRLFLERLEELHYDIMNPHLHAFGQNMRLRLPLKLFQNRLFGTF